MTPLPVADYVHIAVPIVTLLIGIWIGHSGFTGALTQIKSDISNIKNTLHVQTPTVTTPAVTVTPAHA